MEVSKKELSPNEIEFAISLSDEELKPHLEKAAAAISTDRPMAGFRPGKAPYDAVKKEVGELAIYQAAAEPAVAKSLSETLERELPNAVMVGAPEVTVEKLAPGNPFQYRAVITLVPEITVADPGELVVTERDTTATAEAIDHVLTDLRTMRVTETAKLGAVEKGDAVVIDFATTIDGAALEGGQSTGYPLVIGESKFIPGFEEQLVGLNANETREFDLRFPADYHQQSLQNKLAHFTVTVKEVKRRVLPELNDEFAKTLGNFQTVADLRQAISQQIGLENQGREKQRQELELLDTLVQQSTFPALPKRLVDHEVHRMIHELEHSVSAQGLSFADYLTHLKKTEAELETEFRPDAEKRVKVSLVVRQLAHDNTLEATAAEIDAEIERLRTVYRSDTTAQEQLKTAGARDAVGTNITNRKTIDFIASKAKREPAPAKDAPAKTDESAA